MDQPSVKESWHLLDREILRCGKRLCADQDFKPAHSRDPKCQHHLIAGSHNNEWHLKVACIIEWTRAWGVSHQPVQCRFCQLDITPIIHSFSSSSSKRLERKQEATCQTRNLFLMATWSATAPPQSATVACIACGGLNFSVFPTSVRVLVSTKLHYVVTFPSFDDRHESPLQNALFML
jgi:lysozyme family protein